MNKKLVALSAALLVFGEALLVAFFLYFGGGSPTAALTVNIIVSTVVYLLLFSTLIFPLIGSGLKRHWPVALAGVRIFFSLLYSALAVTALVVFALVNTVPLPAQILVHCALLFILAAGFWLASSAAARASAVRVAEVPPRRRVEELRRLAALAVEEARGLSLPARVATRLATLADDCRSLSPCNTQEAAAADSELAAAFAALRKALTVTPPGERLETTLARCESLRRQRHLLFSK